MRWFEVKGFEGSYIVNEDGSEVRSVPRKRWFGNALRLVPGKVMQRNYRGKYVLRSLTKGPTMIDPSEIERGAPVEEI